jgi:hypothetical protein
MVMRSLPTPALSTMCQSGCLRPSLVESLIHLPTLRASSYKPCCAGWCVCVHSRVPAQTASLTPALASAQGGVGTDAGQLTVP